VKFRRIANEAERGPNLLGFPEASEEKKKISATNLMPREMTLRGCGLSEDRTPSLAASDRIAAQIWIQMRAVAPTDSTMRQVFDNPSDRRAVKRTNFGVSGRRADIGNRK